MYICISSNFQLEPPSIAILSRPPTWEEVKSEMPRGPEVDPDLLETPSYRDMSQEEALDLVRRGCWISWGSPKISMVVSAKMGKIYDFIEEQLHERSLLMSIFEESQVSCPEIQRWDANHQIFLKLVQTVCKCWISIVLHYEKGHDSCACDGNQAAPCRCHGEFSRSTWANTSAQGGREGVSSVDQGSL